MGYDYGSWNDEGYPESTIVMRVGDGWVDFVDVDDATDDGLTITLSVEPQYNDALAYASVTLTFVFSPEDEKNFLERLLTRHGLKVVRDEG